MGAANSESGKSWESGGSRAGKRSGSEDSPPSPPCTTKGAPDPENAHDLYNGNTYVDGKLNIGQVHSCGTLPNNDVLISRCYQVSGDDSTNKYQIEYHNCGNRIYSADCIKTTWSGIHKHKCCTGEEKSPLKCEKNWFPFSHDCVGETKSRCMGGAEGAVGGSAEGSTPSLKIASDSCDDIDTYGIGCQTWCGMHPAECGVIKKASCKGRYLLSDECKNWITEKKNTDIPNYPSAELESFCGGTKLSAETVFYILPENPETISAATSEENEASGLSVETGKYQFVIEDLTGDLYVLACRVGDPDNILTSTSFCLIPAGTVRENTTSIFSYRRGSQTEGGQNPTAGGGGGSSLPEIGSSLSVELDLQGTQSSFPKLYFKCFGGSEVSLRTESDPVKITVYNEMSKTVLGSKVYSGTIDICTEEVLRGETEGVGESESPASSLSSLSSLYFTIINPLYQNSNLSEGDLFKLSLQDHLIPEVALKTDMCSCFLGPKFYNNYFNTLYQYLQIPGNPRYPDCFYPDCVRSTFPTRKKLVNPGLCPSNTNCIQNVKFNLRGEVTGDIDISQDSSCGQITLSSSGCPADTYYDPSSTPNCVSCPEEQIPNATQTGCVEPESSIWWWVFGGTMLLIFILGLIFTLWKG